MIRDGDATVIGDKSPKATVLNQDGKAGRRMIRESGDRSGVQNRLTFSNPKGESK